MQLIRGNNQSIPKLSGSVVTLGNFDGVHFGHQCLLEALKTLAKAQNLPTVVVTFEPSPKAFFANMPFPRLSRFRDKWTALASFNIDYLMCLRFNRELAHLSAEHFVKKILVDTLDAKVVIVGDDFRFGAKRTGDFKFLQNQGAIHGFSTEQLQTILIDHERVSSTRIRMALQANDMMLVSRLLNRYYQISGRVIQGDGRGKILGFPTANIHTNHNGLLLSGVFAVRVYGIDANTYYGVASVGARPMLGGSSTLEVHVLDFSGDLYGRRLNIEFLHHIRAQADFSSWEQLKSHIDHDIVLARQFFHQID